MKTPTKTDILRMIEFLASNGSITVNIKELESTLSDIYMLTHSVGTCHAGCPSKRDGKVLAKKMFNDMLEQRIL